MRVSLFHFPNTGVVAVAMLACVLALCVQGSAQDIPGSWRTVAEKTNYARASTYVETVEFGKRLAAESGLIHFEEFGLSAQGRTLPLLIAASTDSASPAAARKSGKLVVLIQACIHAGEPDGNDAGLALMRDIAISKARAKLLDRIVLLFIPILNVDGHVRSSAFNRINQNGPEESGWRTNAANLNLNRDFMKADAPETRAWLQLWNRWNPDLFVDCHVTDGADYRYNLTYEFARHQEVAPVVRDWSTAFFAGRVFPAAERAGNLVSPYLQFRDNRDMSLGIDGFIAGPRFATGYVALRNRPGLLIETHMLKNFGVRVRGTYDLLGEIADELARDSAGLAAVNQQADETAAALGRSYDPARRFVLRLGLTDNPVPFKLNAVESHTELSEVSGALRVVFGPKPLDLTIPRYDEAKVLASVAPPLAYVIPAEWSKVIEVLKLHGLKLRTLAQAQTVPVESYRFSEVRFSPESFEGRHTVSVKSAAISAAREFPAGSVVVQLDQPAAAVAIHLLEPESPDSFVAWGFFDAIFEQKEFAEAYVLERLARDMMQKDERLRREFERKVATDAKFAASASDRLNFFYERSAYYDQRRNLYPVGRIVSAVPLSFTSSL